MLTTILAFLLGLLVPDADADALRSTAPQYLTIESAREHIVAAAIGEADTGVPASLLIYTSWHESRHDRTHRTNEPGGKISCGPMTPIPMHPSVAARHCPEIAKSLVAGYLEGARHIRGWIDAARGDMRTALLGLAGGYVGIRYCNRPENHRDYRCSTHLVFLHGSRVIARTLERSRAKRIEPPSRHEAAELAW